jgi:hypothetical protein|tara:strand:- start:60 stop:248 length:189 start_codon:yes stop_codon:yes gene_type:complete
MRKEKEIKLFEFPWKGQRASISFLSLLKLSPLVSAKYAHIDRHLSLSWRAKCEVAYRKVENK